MSEDKSIMDKLIQLSRIFKKGFTIQINNGNILQYNNKQYNYVVSCETIMEIYNDKKKFKQITLYNMDNCFIGGWFDKNNNTYYIEFNRIFSSLNHATAEAKKYKQKYVYDLNEGKEIKVEY